MHDVLRQRILRRLESLPEEQIYQVLDYIEFLESKYAKSLNAETSRLQRFAENLEDRLRRKAVSPQNLREAFQLIAAADRVLSSVSTAGKEILSELGSLTEAPEERTGPRPGGSSGQGPASPSRSSGGAGGGGGERSPARPPGGGDAPRGGGETP